MFHAHAATCNSRRGRPRGCARPRWPERRRRIIYSSRRVLCGFLQCRQDSPSFATYCGQRACSSHRHLHRPADRRRDVCRAPRPAARLGRRAHADRGDASATRARAPVPETPRSRFRYRPRLRPRRRVDEVRWRATLVDASGEGDDVQPRALAGRARLSDQRLEVSRRVEFAREVVRTRRARARRASRSRASRAWKRPHPPYGSDARPKDAPPRGCAWATRAAPSSPSDHERPRARPCATTARARRRAIRRPSERMPRPRR